MTLYTIKPIIPIKNYESMMMKSNAKILRKRTGRKFVKWLFFIILILHFMAYFVPFSFGWCGESPVLKLRFKVFEYDSHDYGSMNFQQFLFETELQKFGKYGSIVFGYKLGGLKEYFGLAPIFCADSGKPVRKEFQY